MNTLQLIVKCSDLKGGFHANTYFYWLFLNLGSSTVHKIFIDFFVPVVLASSACGGNWARLYVTLQWGSVNVAQYVSSAKNGGQS